MDSVQRWGTLEQAHSQSWTITSYAAPQETRQCACQVSLSLKRKCAHTVDGAHVSLSYCCRKWWDIYAKRCEGIWVGCWSSRPSVQCPILIRTPHFCWLLLPAPVNPTQAIANLNPLNLAPNPPSKF